MPDPLMSATAALEFEMGVSGQAAMAGAAGSLSNMAGTLARMIQNPLVGAGGGAMIGKNIERLVSYFKDLHTKGVDINTIFSMIPWAQVGTSIAGMAVSTGLRIAGAKEDAEDLNQAIQRAVAFDPEEDMGAWVSTAWKMFAEGGESAKRAFEDARDTILPYTRDLSALERKQIAVNAAIMNMTVDPNASRDIVNMSVRMNMGLEEAARRYKDVAIRARQAQVPIREYFQVVDNVTQSLYLYGVETDNVRDSTLMFTQAIREGRLSWNDAAQTIGQLFTTGTTPQGMQQRLMQVAVLDRLLPGLKETTAGMTSLSQLNAVAAEEYTNRTYEQLNAMEQQYVLSRLLAKDGQAYLSLVDQIVNSQYAENELGKEAVHLLYERMGITDQMRRTLQMMQEDVKFAVVDPGAVDVEKGGLAAIRDITEANRAAFEDQMQLMLGQSERYSDILQIHRSVTEQIGADMAQTMNTEMALIDVTRDLAEGLGGAREEYERMEVLAKQLLAIDEQRVAFAGMMTRASARTGYDVPAGLAAPGTGGMSAEVVTSLQTLIQELQKLRTVGALGSLGELVLHIDISDELRRTIRTEIQKAQEGGH